VILDTSIFIETERGEFDLAGFLESIGDEPVALASISASELLHGVERAKDTDARFRRQQFVEHIIGDFPVLAFGLAEARVHARLWSSLASRGISVGPHDLLIAATAVASGTSVATLNQKEFKRIAEVTVAPIAPFVRSKRRRE